METNEEPTVWEKVEAVIFPLAATVIGVGYCLSILINNELSKVVKSPHAIILLVIFVAIAFFPIRSFVRQLSGKSKEKS